MPRFLKVEVKAKEDKPLWALCSICRRETNHDLLSGYETKESDEVMQYWRSYCIIQCRGCHELSFFLQSGDSESFAHDPTTNEWETIISTELFPSRIEGIDRLTHHYYLPHQIRLILEETISALRNKLNILAGIGIRALVEAICKQCNTSGRDLETRINDLAEKKIITPESSKILHSLRFIGNKSAHEVKAHSQKELQIAFQVIEHLLKGVYIIPKLAKPMEDAVRIEAIKKAIKDRSEPHDIHIENAVKKYGINHIQATRLVDNAYAQLDR